MRSRRERTLARATVGLKQEIPEFVRGFCVARRELRGVSLAIRFELLQERRDGRCT
ncbi:MAG: hypothetical protein ABI356_13565 [Steroidobacteraceae bacterium]